MQLVIQIIRNRNDLKMEQVHTQYQIKNLQGRFVMLDIDTVAREKNDIRLRYNVWSKEQYQNE